MANKTETLDGGIRLTVAHDWIRIDLGNNRGLTVSYSGCKATGKIPRKVFDSWCVASEPGENIVPRIKQFATTDLPALWPEWNQAPDTSALVVGARVEMKLGKRVFRGTIESLPKRKGQRYICNFGVDGRCAVTQDTLAASVVPS